MLLLVVLVYLVAQHIWFNHYFAGLPEEEPVTLYPVESRVQPRALLPAPEQDWVSIGPTTDKLMRWIRSQNK